MFHLFDKIETDMYESLADNKLLNVSHKHDEKFKLQRIRKTKIYKYIVGIIDMSIVFLTMPIINALSLKDADAFPKLYITIQLCLTMISLIDQGLNLIAVGMEGIFKDFVQSIDILDSILIFNIGLFIISITDSNVFMGMVFSVNITKLYCVLTILKVMRVISFLRVIKEVRIILDVLVKSTLFLLDLIGMMFIIMLIFSSIGINLFGGIINSENI